MNLRKGGAIVSLLLVGAVFGAPRAVQAESLSCPAVISHAAGPDLAPENSVAGIDRVTAAGAATVEMDVRWSKGDGTASYPGWPVLMHDPTTARTTGVNDTVDTTGLGDLLALSAANYVTANGVSWKTNSTFAGDGPDGKPKTPVPYAYDFLSATFNGGANALLDVKITPNKVRADKLMQYVDDFPAGRSRIIYMGPPDNTTAMHAWYPDLTYAYIEYPPAGTVRSAAAIKAAYDSIYVVPIQNADLSASAVAYWHANGLKVYVWSSDTMPPLPNAYDVQANWKKAADIGADALITNYAAQVTSYYSGLCPA